MTSEKLKGLLDLNELALTDDEQTVMQNIFKAMEQNEKVLEKVDTTDTKVMVHVMPMTNVLREDVRNQPFTRDELLKGAPECSEDSWQVPRLVK